MGTMVLMYGEKDGFEITKMSASSRPDVYYALPNLDEEKIRAIKGNVAKSELRDRLAKLAYRYDPEISTPDRFVMVRHSELDKVLQ